MADQRTSTPAPPTPLNLHERRRLLEAALDRLLDTVEAILADLDRLDGDADQDLGCEDEGFDADTEAEEGDWCNWQEEGDQSRLNMAQPFTYRVA